MTHGDQFGSPTPEKLQAAFPDAEIIVYGHTTPLLTLVDVVVTVMNRGARGRGGSTCRPRSACWSWSPASRRADGWCRSRLSTWIKSARHHPAAAGHPLRIPSGGRHPARPHDRSTARGRRSHRPRGMGTAAGHVPTAQGVASIWLLRAADTVFVAATSRTGRAPGPTRSPCPSTWRAIAPRHPRTTTFNGRSTARWTAAWSIAAGRVGGRRRWTIPIGAWASRAREVVGSRRRRRRARLDGHSAPGPRHGSR